LTSIAILFSEDAERTATWVSALAPHGWRTIITADPADALAALTPDVALVLLDARVADAADVLRRLRAEQQPAGGVPVLQHGGARWDGTSASLPAADSPPSLIAAIELFTGALGDHALRAAPFSPFYRLVRLIGARDAAGIIARFADALRTTLADGTSSPDQAHRLAGLAGAIGYTDLGMAWRAAEQDRAASDAAIATTRATLAHIEHEGLARFRG
jgi:CheY-like chemotaxis protein